MMNKLNITGIAFFSASIFFGWFVWLHPLKLILHPIFNSAEIIKSQRADGPNLNLSEEYISSNQFNIDILHYDLSIDLYPDQKKLKGIAEITGKILDSIVNRIDLNFYDNLIITSLSFNGNSVKYENKDTRLSIFISQASPDTFVLKINYEGTPKRTGLSAFVFGEINGSSVVYNLNEPSYASAWFPCNDMPSDKALLDIRITNDSAITSVSNGILINTTLNGNRKTYHWKTIYPISTYLVCLYSSNYVEFGDKYISADNDTMPINYYAFPKQVEQAKADFKNTVKMIEFFSKIFGEYPFIKEKYGIAEFLWQLGAMEHQTITGIGSNFITGKNYFEDVFVHELAHHWWGNAVGPATWKDIWLNEGFSSYSEVLYDEYNSGKDAMKASMLSKFSDEFSTTLYDPGKNLFGSTVYDKGAWVLHMIRWEVGDSIFFKILRSYFEKFKYSTASTNDFKKICEDLSQKDFTKFFDQWIYTGTENLELDYKWIIKNDSNGKYLIILDLEQTQKKYSVYEFKLEVQFEYDEGKSYSKFFNISEREKRIEIQVDERLNQLILDPNNWLLANIRDRNNYEN